MSVLELDLEGLDGLPVHARVMVRRDTVEIHAGGKIVGICDRDQLRAWLHEARLQWVYDDVAWLRDSDGWSLAIDNLTPNWHITEAVLNDLRSVL